MKLKFTKFSCGLAAAALAFAFVACDDSSSATAPTSEEISSASEAEGVNNHNGKGNQDIESSAEAESSNSVESSTSTGGSSAATGTSSNSSARYSSNSVETCDHITDNECLITQGCAMTPCMDGTKALDCATNLDYVCKGGVWSVATTSSSSSTQPNTPTYSDNCASISGVTGNEKWNCNEEDFTLTTDCNDNNTTYMCISKRWFKTDDCDPTKPNCGYDDYTICLKTALKEYCLRTEWLNESCSYGNDPMRWLYTYNNPEDDHPSNQIRYSCNENGKWEEFVQQCDPMMDCGVNKSDDHGILPDGAPCNNTGEQMTVEGYNYQCINNVWTRL